MKPARRNVAPRGTAALCREAARRGNVIVLALLLAPGCASESKLLRSDPAFTLASLREGGLAVLGVVQVDEVPQVRPALVAALESAIAGARGDIPLVRAARVHEALGDSGTRLFLLGYQLRGAPDSLWLAAAAGAARGLARYGVLARIESAPVRYGSRVVLSRDPGREPDRQVRVTGRDAHVGVNVYDLRTGAEVFRGRYVGAADEAPRHRPASPGADSLDVEPPPDSGRPVAGADAGPLMIPGPGESPHRMGYPEEPTVAAAAAAAFLEFARSIPGPLPPR